jgi:hypothetical protein
LRDFGGKIYKGHSAWYKKGSLIVVKVPGVVMASILLAILLAVALVVFLRTQRDIERRIASQRNTPLDQLVPRHYKSFTQVEAALWSAVREHKRSMTWEEVRFTTREPEFRIIRDYIGGLRDDFHRSHRIFGQVIIHSPDMKLFGQLEWQRVKIEVAYYKWCMLAGLRLRTVGISIQELRQLTEIVATLAYRVRSMLTTFENSGHVDFVDSILRRS